MTDCAQSSRVLLISQWPNVKNGEYELIEKIKQTGYRVAVVDYFGFDVESGECLNRATLPLEFDFAISFHYDTPKFLNIPTFLWVANPLEFMHLRGDYRSVLLHHLRAYDDYLYNGSDTLSAHIRNVVGSEWKDTGLEMFPSCSRSAMISPKPAEKLTSDSARKVFYCGVNWERGIDRAGRAQGLLDILQERNAADFYGPNKLEGISPWEGFSSYKGEIPFDGVSMGRVMQDYGAVLAVSSPAHIKSRTSSSRVFEGVAAGVPVISDENAHVRKHFGDLVYYFKGNTEEERAASILAALDEINGNPSEARRRVIEAQRLMANRYCFEPCFERVLKAVRQNRYLDAASTQFSEPTRFDVFLFHHDQDPDAPGSGPDFHNVWYVLEAASRVARVRGIQVRITCTGGKRPAVPVEMPAGVIWRDLESGTIADRSWEQLRLGEKVARLAQSADGAYAAFFTQFDFPHYDSLEKPLDWFAHHCPTDAGLHIGGFYVNDLTQKAPMGTVGILRNNASVGMYRWSQNSLAEHQLATLCFNRPAMSLLQDAQTSRFDSVLPVSLIAGATGRGMKVHRSRFLLARVQCGAFHRHYEAYRRATEKGFWAPHYELVANYNHELNALYDVHHESELSVRIADRVAGHSLPPVPPVDPAVHVVNAFVGRLRPIYRAYKAVRRVVRLERGGVQ